jgi:hypothetical protein
MVHLSDQPPVKQACEHPELNLKPVLIQQEKRRKNGEHRFPLRNLLLLTFS